jgi:hypothetical protein
MKYKDFYQYLLEENKSQQSTPQFKNWFKNSKVVDEQGNPLKVYHGTSKDSDFSKFNEKRNGIWFTSDPKSASSYAEQNDSMKIDRDWNTMKWVNINSASRVIPVYLSLQNPAKLTDEQMEKLKRSENYRKAQLEVFDQLKRAGHDGVDFGHGNYVVFKSTQIKSAIGNNGEFNPSNPNINK